MKIVVIGGTGLIGSKLVNRLNMSGHTILAAAPGLGINTLTGEGLYDAVKEAAAIQPVAADEVVQELTDIIMGKPLNAITEIAGPVLMPMSEFIRYFMNTTEDWRQLVEDEHAFYFGTELNEQSLVPGEKARLGRIKYEDLFTRQIINETY